MSSHEFARLLLRLPEQQIAFTAAGHAYYPDQDDGPTSVYLVDGRYIMVGDELEPPPGTLFEILWKAE